MYRDEKQQPNLITHVEVEPAHESDAHALLPAIEAVKGRNLAPGQVLADSLYGSDDNIEKAAAQGVEVIAPAMGKAKEAAVTLADFEFSENNTLLRCPAGYAPERIRVGKRGGYRVRFAKDLCDGCPQQSACPVIREKRHCTLSYDDKVLRLTRRRAREKTAAFREIYRFRAGVEATMSELDRTTGVKHLRVRGMRAVRYAAKLKATGLNILRAAAFRNRRLEPKDGPDRPNSRSNGAYQAVKERFRAIVDRSRHNFPGNCPASDFLAMTAYSDENSRVF